MRKIQWIARQLATVIEGRWKPIFSSAMLLLSLSVPVPSATGASSAPPPEQILTRMERRYQQQLQALGSYQDRRRYSVAHRLLGNGTYWVVEENFLAPEEKRFQVVDRGGSEAVQNRVFARLLEVEQETARESVRPQVDLSRSNYDFTFEGYDAKDDAYVFQAEPRGSNPYLLRGRIWVNAQDFAVQRIEGEPAMRPSALVRQVRFVHEFARFGDFWFPVHHRSETELRLFGTAVLEISYSDYRWQAQKEARP